MAGSADASRLSYQADGFHQTAANGTDTLVGTFNTFAGTDMTVFFGNREVGTLMSLTASVVRETVPIYTTSSSNPRAFAKGKRAISGSLVFGQFDRHALLEGVFYDQNVRKLTKVDFSARSENLNSQDLLSVAEGIYTDLSYDRNYSDQLPPFDVVVTMINENGAAAAFAVQDVVIVNEGFGFTVDDITQEMACSYVARAIRRLIPVSNKSEDNIGSLLTNGTDIGSNHWS